MLGRAASSIYWMSRNIERAENTARLAEVGFRITMTPDTGDGHREEWRSTLTSAGVIDRYLKKYDVPTGPNALSFLLFDSDNPSSVYSCLKSARTNGRIVRTSITRDMWEALNGTWLAFANRSQAQLSNAELPGFLDWIKQQTSLFRGVLLGTILRTDTYYFSQLGAFVERADNTARILDVKYYLLLPSNQTIGGDIDTYHWETILRSVSAHRSYRHVYHDVYSPWNIAEFLILQSVMPRSLRFCYDWAYDSAAGLCDYYGSSNPAREKILEVRAKLNKADMDAIFAEGLHEFLIDFIATNQSVNQAISDHYNFS